MLSVIIPTYHRNDLLALCLQRLAPGRQSLSSEEYEVIVTDDGSQSTAASMIAEKYPWARWVEGPRRGPAANRNNGARQAKGDWLVFTDDDCLPDKGWLEAYLLAIKKKPSIKVFEGRTYADREKRRLDEEAPINETGGYLWSCNFAIDAQLFSILNGFDEDFPYAAMEDVDFHYRLKRCEKKIIFLNKAAVCHPWRTAKSWKSWNNHFNSTIIYINKHPQEKKKINSMYYLKMNIIIFFRDTIPNMITFKCKGLSRRLILHISFLKSSISLIKLS